MSSTTPWICLVGSPDNAWVKRFRDAAEGRYLIWAVSPDDIGTCAKPEAVAKGVVVYYEENLDPCDSRWFERLRNCVRYMELPLVAVTPHPSLATRAQLLAAGASAVCDANEPVEKILKEVECHSNGEPVLNAARQHLLQPFIDATIMTLREMTDAQVRVQSVYRKQGYRIFGDHSAVVALKTQNEGTVVLSFPKETSQELARRLLAPLGVEVTEELLQSCLTEVANIIVGQAKGRLANTDYRFTMSLPTVVSGSNHEIRYKQGIPCYVALFSSDIGDFALQLCLTL